MEVLWKYKVTVPAGGTADVTVTLTMKASDVPSSLKSQNSQNFYEASGNVYCRLHPPSYRSRPAVRK